jgi:putative ABC transport system ATP-binding protein
MKEINGNFKTTFIFSTHDARVMAMADRVVSIEDGQLTKEEVRDEKKHANRTRGATPAKIG